MNIATYHIVDINHMRTPLKPVIQPFSYPEPFLRAVNGPRRGALAKSKSDTIKTWYPVKQCACSILIDTMFLLCFYCIQFGFS
jgi:hypothetical protein